MLWTRLFCVIALIFVSFGFDSNLFAQTTADDDGEVIKVDVALVNIPFSVSDRDGRNIQGLNIKNFQFFEDGKLQPIEYLSTQDAPLNIVLLLDTSQSAVEIFEKIKKAATEFTRQLRPTDRCMIIGFDGAARVKSEFTNDPKILENAIKNTVLSQKPGTVMRDTISVTVDKELTKIKGRKAIILITDGKDAGSVMTKDNLLYRLAESDAPIYSIYYQTVNVPVLTVPQKKGKETPKPQVYQFSQKELKKILADKVKQNEEAADYLTKMSDITAGRSYRKEIDNLGEAFNNIAEELRMQYLIGFYPSDSKYDISQHQFKIKVDKTNIVVRMKSNSLSKYLY